MEAIFQGAWVKTDWRGRMRHFAYAAAWKKFEPMWDLIIRTKKVARLLPLLETILDGRVHRNSEPHARICQVAPKTDAEETGQERASQPITFASADFFD
jgi:hypothetical protein